LNISHIQTGQNLRDNDEDSDLQSDDDTMLDMVDQSLPARRLRVDEPQHQSVEGDVSETLDGPAVEAHVELAITPRKSVLSLVSPS